MIKRIMAVLVLSVFCLALGLVLSGWDKPVHLSQLYVDSETWMNLMAERQEYSPSDKDQRRFFDAVYFDGYSLACDRTNNMLLYSLIENSKSAHNPSVKVASSHFDVKIAFLGYGITDQLIRENKAIEVLLYTDRYYVQYQLKCTTLPVVRIDIPASDIGEEYVKMQFRLFDNRREADYRIVASQAEIHLRGRHSMTLPKNDYRISLKSKSSGGSLRNNHVSLLGMRQDDDWIIKGLYSDKDRIREVFSTSLWYNSCADHNGFGIKNGIDYRYVEVFLDEQYWGIYALCHPLDAKQMKLNPGDAFFRKAGNNSEAGMDFNAVGSIPGYEYLGNELENPDWEPLRRYYRTLFYDGEGSDYIRQLYNSADIDNSIDVFLFFNLIQGVDNVNILGKNSICNMYLTIKGDGTGNERMIYTPWDMDRTWGFNLHDKYVMDIEKNVIMDTNVVTRLLELGDEEIVKRVTRRYRELRAKAWSDAAVGQMLAKYEKDIFFSGAYAREYEKWCLDSEQMMTTDLTEFTQYVLDRLEYMDSFITALECSPEEFAQSRKKQNKKEIVREVFDGNFTNMLPRSVDTDGRIYNGIGYEENMRLSTTSHSPKTANGWFLTGCISANKGDVIRLGNVSFLDVNNEALEHRAQVYFYDADYNFISNSDIYWPENLMSEAWNPVYNENGDVIQFTIPTSYSSSIAYFRLCARHLDEYSVITVNEEIR